MSNKRPFYSYEGRAREDEREAKRAIRLAVPDFVATSRVLEKNGGGHPGQLAKFRQEHWGMETKPVVPIPISDEYINPYLAARMPEDVYRHIMGFYKDSPNDWEAVSRKAYDDDVNRKFWRDHRRIDQGMPWAAGLPNDDEQSVVRFDLTAEDGDLPWDDVLPPVYTLDEGRPNTYFAGYGRNTYDTTLNRPRGNGSYWYDEFDEKTSPEVFKKDRDRFYSDSPVSKVLFPRKYKFAGDSVAKWHVLTRVSRGNRDQWVVAHLPVKYGDKFAKNWRMLMNDRSFARAFQFWLNRSIRDWELDKAFWAVMRKRKQASEAIVRQEAYDKAHRVQSYKNNPSGFRRYSSKLLPSDVAKQRNAMLKKHFAAVARNDVSAAIKRRADAIRYNRIRLGGVDDSMERKLDMDEAVRRHVDNMFTTAGLKAVPASKKRLTPAKASKAFGKFKGSAIDVPDIVRGKRGYEKRKSFAPEAMDVDMPRPRGVKRLNPEDVEAFGSVFAKRRKPNVDHPIEVAVAESAAEQVRAIIEEHGGMPTSAEVAVLEQQLDID